MVKFKQGVWWQGGYKCRAVQTRGCTALSTTVMLILTVIETKLLFCVAGEWLKTGKEIREGGRDWKEAKQI